MKNMHHATHLPLELGCSQVHTPLENVCTDRKANDPNLWPPCNTLITNKKSYPTVVPQIWNVPFSSRTDDDSIESFFPPYLILAPSLNYRRFENVFTRDRWLQKLFSPIASFFLNRGFSINCLRFQRRLTQFFFFFSRDRWACFNSRITMFPAWWFLINRVWPYNIFIDVSWPTGDPRILFLFTTFRRKTFSLTRCRYAIML